MKTKINVNCFNALKVASSAGLNTLKSKWPSAQSVIATFFNQVPPSESFSFNITEWIKRTFSHEITLRLNPSTTELQVNGPSQAPVLDLRALSKAYRYSSKVYICLVFHFWALVPIHHFHTRVSKYFWCSVNETDSKITLITLRNTNGCWHWYVIKKWIPNLWERIKTLWFRTIKEQLLRFLRTWLKESLVSNCFLKSAPKRWSQKPESPHSRWFVDPSFTVNCLWQKSANKPMSNYETSSPSQSILEKKLSPQYVNILHQASVISEFL